MYLIYLLKHWAALASVTSFFTWSIFPSVAGFLRGNFGRAISRLAREDPSALTSQDSIPLYSRWIASQAPLKIGPYAQEIASNGHNVQKYPSVAER